MSSQFFQNFPEIQYKLNDGRTVTIKDFFRKAKVDNASIANIVDYQYYELSEGERPDVVATKLYGNPDLHWVLFLVNNFETYTDWYKSQESFESYIDEKYNGDTLTAATTADIIDTDSKFLLGERVSCPNGKKLGYVTGIEPTFKRIHIDVIGERFEAWQTGDAEGSKTAEGLYSGKTFRIESVTRYRDAVAYYTNGTLRSNKSQLGFDPVTFYEMEYELNESRRLIKVVQPNKVKAIVSEFERVMKN